MVIVDPVHLQYIHCHVTVLSHSMVEPWCVMGNFNVVFEISHRSNGRLVSTYEMQDLL